MLLASTGAMDIDEAAAIVAGPRTPALGAALNALGAFLAACAKKGGASKTEAEDVAQDVVIKLMRRRQAGEDNWLPAQHHRYLKTCALNAVRDLRRRDKHLAPLPDEVVDAQIASSPEHEELGHLAKDSFDKAAQFARARRLPRYRAEFDEAWAELQAMFYDDAPLRTLLEAKLGGDTSLLAYSKARDRAYKAHQRTRESLLQALNHLRESGELTAIAADLASRALGVFVRCQRAAPPRVRTPKGLP